MNRTEETILPKFLKSTRFWLVVGAILWAYLLIWIIFFEDGPSYEIRNVIYPEKKNLIAIVGTWGSGAKFLNELLRIDGVFDHFEPLNNHQFDLSLHDSLEVVTQNFECHLNESQKTWIFNKQFNCETNPSQCDLQSAVELCKNSSNHVMKFSRKSPEFIEDLILSFTDVQGLVMVRDPRAIWHAQKSSENCQTESGCLNLPEMCMTLVDYFNESQKLTEKYPNQVVVIKYEQLFDNFAEQTEELFEFLELQIDEKYLLAQNYTNNNDWIEELPFWEILKVQEECKDAMELWGYRLITNETELSSGIQPEKKSSLVKSLLTTIITSIGGHPKNSNSL